MGVSDSGSGTYLCRRCRHTLLFHALYPDARLDECPNCGGKSFTKVDPVAEMREEQNRLYRQMEQQRREAEQHAKRVAEREGVARSLIKAHWILMTGRSEDWEWWDEPDEVFEGRRSDLSTYSCPLCWQDIDVETAATALQERLDAETQSSIDAVRFIAKDGRFKQAAFVREFGDKDEALSKLDALARLQLVRRIDKGTWRLNAAPCPDCAEEAADVPSEFAPLGQSTLPAQLRFRVLQRDGFRCAYCGRSARDGAVLQVDHVIPRAAGGSDSEDNLISACAECNLGKSDFPVI